MISLDALQKCLGQLMVICLTSSAVDALFDDDAQGVRLLCGLSTALCLGRMVKTLLQ